MPPLSLYSFPFGAMATPCIIHLYSGSQAEAGLVAQRAQAEIARIELRYSRYRPGSFLSQINQVAAHGGSVDLDEETASLFAYARSCHEKSDGLFDITSGILRRAWDFGSGKIPKQEEVDQLLPFVGLEKIEWDLPRVNFRVPGMEIDLGGIGKEYAADRAAAVCISSGIKHGVVDLGGDVRVIGPHPDRSPWEIGIRHPFAPDTIMGKVELSEGALATSGDYQRRIVKDGKRYGHLLDPRTGWPIQGLASVSVVADQCLAAGSLTTVAMLRGVGGKNWLAGLRPDLRYLWIDSEGNLGGSIAAGFPSPIKPLSQT